MNNEYPSWSDDHLNRELCTRMGWKWEATPHGQWIAPDGTIQPVLPLYTSSYDLMHELEDKYVNTTQRSAYYDGYLLTLLGFNRGIEIADVGGVATLDFVELCAKLRSVSPRHRVIALLALADKLPDLFSTTKTP